ncbi:MAG TPA: hypothetical protein RMG48_03000 [Myxococcales bacterium LLY-WYZ-16_1]|jgi:hypothetical protein|nr:hypothetical protein [Myxococcales bacterium LLY-WYZ-16_1]
MLEQVLVRSILRAAGVLGGLAVLGAGLGQGRTVALGVAAGVALFSGSGVVLTMLVTRLLDPEAPNKGALGVLLALKGAAVLGLAWVLMKRVDPTGFAFGLVTGVFSVVFGLQSGGSSPAGRAAMEAQERKIRDHEEAKKDPDSANKNR